MDAELELVKSLSHMMGDAEQWEVIPAQFRTRGLLSLAFRLISMTSAMGYQELLQARRIYPFKLFRLIAEPSLRGEIMSDPDCLLDALSRSFREADPE